jgi:hypothetical protein
VERQIAHTYIDLVTRLIVKQAEQLQKKATGMSPSVTLMRDALNDDELGCDLAVCGAGRTTRESWNNGSRYMISWSITASHSDADEIDTRSILQRS